MRALFALVLLTIAASCRRRRRRLPNRPVRIVVPFPAGGPTDINMRILGQKLSELWGQSVVIENRPAPTPASARRWWRSRRPTGYTLLAAMDTTLVMNRRPTRRWT
jgi:tripartite-type tricarboxylate transporter receptor subunit TctC